MGLLDMPTHYEQIAAGTRAKVADDFAKYGLELVDFFINAITPPDEVQQAIDARSSMGAVGDLNAFMKFQAANSMAKLAKQGGGAGDAGIAMGMGMGAGFGMMMPGMIREAMMAGAPQAAADGDAALSRRPQPPAGPQMTPLGMTSPVLPQRRSVPLADSDFDDLTDPRLDPTATWSATSCKPAVTKLEENGDDVASDRPGRHDAETNRYGHLRPARRRATMTIVSFRSTCGPATEQNAQALLRYNTKLVQGAFAFDKIGDREMVVLQATLHGRRPHRPRRLASHHRDRLASRQSRREIDRRNISSNYLAKKILSAPAGAAGGARPEEPAAQSKRRARAWLSRTIAYCVRGSLRSSIRSTEPGLGGC